MVPAWPHGHLSLRPLRDGPAVAHRWLRRQAGLGALWRLFTGGSGGILPRNSLRIFRRTSVFECFFLSNWDKKICKMTGQNSIRANTFWAGWPDSDGKREQESALEIGCLDPRMTMTGLKLRPLLSDVSWLPYFQLNLGPRLNPIWKKKHEFCGEKKEARTPQVVTTSRFSGWSLQGRMELEKVQCSSGPWPWGCHCTSMAPELKMIGI